MKEYDVELISLDPQQRPEAICIYRICAVTRMEAGIEARKQLSTPDHWKVLDVKQRA